MKIEFHNLPEQFPYAIIAGDVHEAFVPVGNELVKIELDSNDCETIKEIRLTHRMDNVGTTLRYAKLSLDVENISRDELLVKLRQRSKAQSSALWLDLLQSSDEVPAFSAPEKKINFLENAKKYWTPENAPLIRIQTIMYPHESMADGLVDFCAQHGYPEFADLFTEVIACSFYIHTVGPVFRNVFTDMNLAAHSALLDRGIIAEAATSLAQNDFDRLDKFVAANSIDPYLTSLQSDIGKKLTAFLQELRANALSHCVAIDGKPQPQ